MANKNQQHHSSGVALVELSIALVIVGLLTAGFFAFLNTSQIAIDLDVKKSISGHRTSVARCTLPKLMDIKCVLADCSDSIGAYP